MWNIEAIARQLICRHENLSGGNDYLLCSDCGLAWDYTKVSPVTALKMYNHPLIVAQATPAVPPADKPTMCTACDWAMVANRYCCPSCGKEVSLAPTVALKQSECLNCIAGECEGEHYYGE